MGDTMLKQAVEVVAFDVYGTLLGFSSLAEWVRRMVGDVPLLDRWRAKQLEHSFLRTILDEYLDFWTVTQDALDAACAELELHLTRQGREQLLQGWLELEPFPEVPQALQVLKDRGRRLAVLSNGSSSMLEKVLEHSRLRSYFEAVLSVDAVQRYKPAPAVYALAPATFAVPPEQIFFCTANGFDVAGAIRFGFQVCWVRRGREVLDAIGVQPHQVIHSLDELVHHL